VSDIIDLANEAAEFNLQRALADRLKSARGVSAKWCAECDMAIPEARRQALPGVQLCIDCARAQETKGKQFL
jgi:phage/conjugal plasmid C-4 type zinc finger TraR family protein